MFHPHIAFVFRGDTEGGPVHGTGAHERRLDESDEFPEEERLAEERALDRVLEDSFPASDPPSWTLGVVPR